MGESQWRPTTTTTPAPPQARPSDAPRSIGRRRAVGGVAVVLFLLMDLVPEEIGWQLGYRPAESSGVHWGLPRLIGTVLQALVLLLLLRRVSYRRRDALMVLIPIWCWFLAARVGYRLAGLPYRDWPPRPDEEPRVRAVPGTPTYVLAADEAPILPEPTPNRF